jgi:hypothetical protein
MDSYILWDTTKIMKQPEEIKVPYSTPETTSQEESDRLERLVEMNQEISLLDKMEHAIKVCSARELDPQPLHKGKRDDLRAERSWAGYMRSVGFETEPEPETKPLTQGLGAIAAHKKTRRGGKR